MPEEEKKPIGLEIASLSEKGTFIRSFPENAESFHQLIRSRIETERDKEYEALLDKLTGLVDGIADKMTIVSKNFDSMIVSPSTLIYAWRIKKREVIDIARELLRARTKKIHELIDSISNSGKVDPETLTRLGSELDGLIQFIRVLHTALREALLRNMNILLSTALPAKYRNNLANIALSGVDRVE